MITDGYIILQEENKEVPTIFNLAQGKDTNTLELDDLVGQIDDGGLMTIFKVTNVVRNNPARPDTIGMDAVGFSKVWEHHVDIEV